MHSTNLAHTTPIPYFSNYGATGISCASTIPQTYPNDKITKSDKEYVEVEIEMDDLIKRTDSNIKKINEDMTTLLQGTSKITDTLIDQGEQLERISSHADKLDRGIDKAQNKAGSINNKLNRSVWPLYICIVIQFIIIIALIIAVSKTVYCLVSD